MVTLIDNSEQILAKLISFDTVSRNPNKELISYIADLLDNAGISSQLIPDATGKKANLYATVGASDVGGIMLSGHTDVVPVDGQNWTKPPFELTMEDGRLYGRGTADMKGFVASAVATAIKASKRKLKVPLSLAFSYDEEIGCVGVRSMIELLDKAPVKPAMCIVGEPTNMQVATGHKGKTALRAIFTGVEGHSALAPNALNALHLGSDFISILRETQTELCRSGTSDADYDIPYTTVHAGKMSGGVALNIVPNRCEIDFEIRNILGDDTASIIEIVRDKASALIEIHKTTHAQADISIEVVNSYPGLDTLVDADVVKFVQSLTGANSTAKIAFGTEGGLFSSQLRIPTVVCGPGSMAQGHKPDEFIERDQIRRCDAMLDALIERLVLGF